MHSMLSLFGHQSYYDQIIEPHLNALLEHGLSLFMTLCYSPSPPFKSDIRVEDKRNPNLDVALGLDFLSGILLIQPFMFSLRVILCNILIGSQIFKRLTAPSVLLFMNSKAHMTDFPITSIL